MKRVWKPVAVGCLRLYEVKRTFSRHPEWNASDIVAAQSPSEAAQLIKDLYADAQWQDGPPIITGHALDVYHPEE